MSKQTALPIESGFVLAGRHYKPKNFIDLVYGDFFFISSDFTHEFLCYDLNTCNVHAFNSDAENILLSYAHDVTPFAWYRHCVALQLPALVYYWNFKECTDGKENEARVGKCTESVGRSSESNG